jgi:hypothetical protein
MELGSEEERVSKLRIELNDLHARVSLVSPREEQSCVLECPDHLWVDLVSMPVPLEDCAHIAAVEVTRKGNGAVRAVVQDGRPATEPHSPPELRRIDFWHEDNYLKGGGNRVGDANRDLGSNAH